MHDMKCALKHSDQLLSLTENVRGVKPLKTGYLSDESFCDIIGSDLPSFCVCTNKTLGGTVTCSTTLPEDIDTVSVVADISPCQEPASMSLALKESRFGISYNLAHVAAREDINIPIPGVSFDIPDIANAGLDLVVRLDGDLAMMTIKLGINVCSEIVGESVCMSSLTSYFPVFLLDGTFQFSSMCSARDVASQIYIE